MREGLSLLYVGAVLVLNGLEPWGSPGSRGTAHREVEKNARLKSPRASITLIVRILRDKEGAWGSALPTG